MQIFDPAFKVVIYGDAREKLVGIEYIVMAHYTGLPVNRTIAFIKAGKLNDAQSKRQGKRLRGIIQAYLSAKPEDKENKSIYKHSCTVHSLQYFRTGVIVNIDKSVLQDRYGRPIKENDVLGHFSGYCVKAQRATDNELYGTLICEAEHPDAARLIPLGSGTLFQIIDERDATVLPVTKTLNA